MKHYMNTHAHLRLKYVSGTDFRNRQHELRLKKHLPIEIQESRMTRYIFPCKLSGRSGDTVQNGL
jgi:hypothetical protein